MRGDRSPFLKLAYSQGRSRTENTVRAQKISYIMGIASAEPVLSAYCRQL
nr:hypothetical protein [Fischerella sp. PCC 9605]